MGMYVDKYTGTHVDMSPIYLCTCLPVYLCTYPEEP